MRGWLRRAAEIERLETLLSAVWGGALQGDSKSVDTAARLVKRLGKLKGLDPSIHRRSLRCFFGLHDDGTDVFGGCSPTCLRCGIVLHWPL